MLSQTIIKTKDPNYNALYISRRGFSFMDRASFLERVVFSLQLATSHDILFFFGDSLQPLFQKFFLFHEFRFIL